MDRWSFLLVAALIVLVQIAVHGFYHPFTEWHEWEIWVLLGCLIMGFSAVLIAQIMDRSTKPADQSALHDGSEELGRLVPAQSSGEIQEKS
jgi:hypothetical protein